MATSLLWNLGSFYVYILIGVVLKKVVQNRVPKLNKIMTWLVMDLFIPIQIFLSLTLTTFGTDPVFLTQILGMGLASILILMGTSYLILHKKVSDSKMLGSYLLLNSLPNSILYVVPIVIALYNEELTIIPVLYAVMAQFLRGTLVTWVCQKLGTDKPVDFKKTLITLFTFPPFVALVIGFVVRFAGVPIAAIPSIGVIKLAVDQISSGVAGVLIGVILGDIKLDQLKTYKKPLGIVALWRFGVAFLFYMPCVYFLHFPIYQTEIRTLLFIIFLGPPAVFNVAFSIYFHLEEKFTAVAVASLTLVSLMLLPIFLWFGASAF